MMNFTNTIEAILYRTGLSNWMYTLLLAGGWSIQNKFILNCQIDIFLVTLLDMKLCKILDHFKCIEHYN